MAVTYEPIASQTLGSDAASVTFSSIPGTYTDLRLVVQARSSHTTYDYLGIIINSDTGTNYSSTYIYGNGSTASSGRYTSGYDALLSYAPVITNSATTWSIATVDVMSYANTNVFKTALAASAFPDLGVQRYVSLWRSTSAITSLQFDLYSANFKSGSTFSLYGIKAA